MKKAAMIVLALLAAGPAAAQSIPKLNYKATCDATPPVGMDKKATVQSCLGDEKEALAALPPFWAKSTPKSRAECTAETSQGGMPSYVELLTCIQGNLIATQ